MPTANAVRAAVEVAPVVERRLLRELSLAVGHADAGRLEGELRTRGVGVLAADWGAAVTLRLGVEPAQEPDLRRLLAELTSGAAEPEHVGETWVDRA